MSIFKLIINERLPNLNEYTDACRRNRYAGAQMKKNTQKTIRAYVKEQLEGVHFDAPVIIHFEWHEPNRKRDLDNIAFAKKFILDALVQCGVLNTDGWKGVSGFTDSFAVSNEPKVIVEIEFDDTALPF